MAEPRLVTHIDDFVWPRDRHRIQISLTGCTGPSLSGEELKSR